MLVVVHSFYALKILNQIPNCVNTSEPRGSKDGPKIQQCSKVRNIMTVGATEDKKWLTVNDGWKS